MSVTVEWDDSAQTIVRMTFSGHWTNEELHTTGLQCILMIRSVDHPVYVISDFSASENLPVGILWQARDLNQLRPSNWAGGITVTQDGLVKNLLDLFGIIYLAARRKRLHVVGTVAEARALIDTLKRDDRVS